MPCLNQLLDGLSSDGSVDRLLFRFVILMASRWCIMARSCRLASSSRSNVISAVMSQIKPALGCRHQEGFMSSHMVNRLVFKGPSQEPQSKLTCPFSSGTEGSTTRSSKIIPSSGCSSISIPVSSTRSTQKLRVRFPGFLIHEGIIRHPRYARHILERLQFPSVAKSFCPLTVSINSRLTFNPLLEYLLTSSNLR